MLHFTKSTSFSWIYQFSFLTECLRADENGFAGRICPAGRSSESLTLSKRSKTSLNDSTRRDHSIKIVLPHLLMLQKDFWSDAARIMRTQRILSITSPLHYSHVRYRLWRSGNNILNCRKSCWSKIDFFVLIWYFFGNFSVIGRFFKWPKKIRQLGQKMSENAILDKLPKCLRGKKQVLILR